MRWLAVGSSETSLHLYRVEPLRPAAFVVAASNSTKLCMACSLTVTSSRVMSWY